MSDWADKEAAEIAAFLLSAGTHSEALEIVALRLRIIKSLGVSEGIENVSKALAETHQEQAA